ncbi:MAG: thiol reductant ABC exporter subunit CydD [Anaerolineae bacterium]|nr:thiol reductant ABC exporter subunit CydD [Anaerolineae bacterium]
MTPHRRLISEAWQVRLYLILTIVCGLIGGVLMVGQAWLLSRIIDRVFLSGAGLSDQQSALLMLLIVGVTRALLIWLGESSAGRVAAGMQTRLRRRLFDHIMALGPAFTGSERSGELASTLVQGIDALDAYFSQYLPRLALAALVPLTILIVVFPHDLLSGVVLLVTAPLIPLFMILIGNMADALTRKQYRSLSRMSAHFLDVLQGLTTLKAFGRSRDQVQAIERITGQFRDTTMGVLRVAFLSALVLEMVGTISTAIVAVEIGLRLLYARMAFVDALFILLLAPEYYLPLRALGASFHAGMSGVAAAERIFEVLDRPAPPIIGLPIDREFGVSQTPINRPKPIIRFDDVYATYEDGTRPALNGVSFTIHPGEKIALVGPSGAGKSTLINLLLRFVDPSSGSITVDGRPLESLSPDWWRSHVAWVQQRPYLFNDSAAANIALARPDAHPDDIRRAAELAHAHEFIEELPQGYDTPIGERGARLSGGQAQRIALARAFLKDSPLVLLDEATANLDPALEALIRESIRRLLADRTALIIAHRLNTVTAADRVIVLDGGRVVQVGSPAALSQVDGAYRRLIAAYGGES